jgi:hypothetical protein
MIKKATISSSVRYGFQFWDDPHDQICRCHIPEVRTRFGDDYYCTEIAIYFCIYWTLFSECRTQSQEKRSFPNCVPRDSKGTLSWHWNFTQMNKDVRNSTWDDRNVSLAFGKVHWVMIYYSMNGFVSYKIKGCPLKPPSPCSFTSEISHREIISFSIDSWNDKHPKITRKFTSMATVSSL